MVSLGCSQELGELRFPSPISVCRLPGHDRGDGKRLTPGSVKKETSPGQNSAASRAASSTTRVLAPPGHVTLLYPVASLWQDPGAAALEEPRMSDLCPVPVARHLHWGLF